MPELQDPVAVINSLKARIAELERQLQIERAAAKEDHEAAVHSSVRHLRLHCVIPLYVGDEDFDTVRAEVRKSSPLLVGAIEEVWNLRDAPIPENAKAALFAAANKGMDRW